MASYISTHTGLFLDNALDNFALPFSTSKTYAVKDMVTYLGKLYKCKTAIAVAGAWDPTKWDEINVADALKAADMEWGEFGGNV